MAERIHSSEVIEINGFTWRIQEVDKPDGNLEVINVYDADGSFVAEFNDYKEMLNFLKGAIPCE